MTNIFNGMTGPLNTVFGGPVTIYPKSGAVSVTGILRNEPVDTVGDEGEPVLAVLPVLKIKIGDAGGLARGDLVVGGDGTRYLVRHIEPSMSPASDRFETFVLRKDDT